MNITSIDKLLKEIKQLKEENTDKELYFRGQIADYGSIKPAIGRNGWLKHEDEMFKDFILRNPQDFKDCKTTFEKLAKMQHYSLPTRLLDITSDPLAALYFALESQEYEKYKGGETPKGINEKNALLVIYAIPKDNIKHYDSDTISVLSNVARRPIDKIDMARIRKGTSLILVEDLEKDLKYVTGLIEKYRSSTGHEIYDDVRNSLNDIHKELKTARDISLQYHESLHELPSEEGDFKNNITNVTRAIQLLYETLMLLPPIGDYSEASKVHEYKNKNYLISAINSQTDLQYLLHEIKEEKPYFQDLIDIEHLQKTWCVKPLMDNRRIINQSGTFLLFGIGQTKSDLSSDDEYIATKYSIHPRSKEKLRVELNTLNITKAKIYPELDKVAEYLKDLYKE